MSNLRIAAIVWVNKSTPDAHGELYIALRQLKGVEHVEVFMAADAEDVVAKKAADLIKQIAEQIARPEEMG